MSGAALHKVLFLPNLTELSADTAPGCYDSESSVNMPAAPIRLPQPFRRGPIRFAVGPPDGITSNSWRVWTSGSDVYLLCRDSFFRTVKVSLHASGRWRIGFTEEAVKADPTLVAPGADRAWSVWDAPRPILPSVVTAFRLRFPASELAVEPSMRTTKLWKSTMFIEAAPAGSGKQTTITVFITDADVALRADSGPSFRLASLELSDGRWVQLVAHAEDDTDTQTILQKGRDAAVAQAESAGIEVPDTAYTYFFGHSPDGGRFLVGARAYPGL